MSHPSLPSIHFLLNEYNDPIHRIPSDTKISIPVTAPAPITQQQSSPSPTPPLSLSAPAHNYNIPSERSENHQPSWMMTAPSSTPLMTSTTTNNRRSNSHIRSVSDLSMINLVTHPSLTQVRNQRHQTHKRSASANTTTMHNNSSNSSLPFIDEHSTSSRARTHSPPDYSSKKYTDSPQQKLLFDALNINNERQHPTLFLNQVEEGTVKLGLHKDKSSSPPSTTTIPKEYENVMVARDEQTGRYYCPFCNKAFNRPSSLRIHTYSHTGEKPFVCQEEGCGRQFSVQSNMRRHLRVHRLGRAKASK
ncbi:unnamed protein product [Mucor hiemalis]